MGYTDDKTICIGKAPLVDHRENAMREGSIVILTGSWKIDDPYRSNLPFHPSGLTCRP
jgi:hypothetical protein